MGLEVVGMLELLAQDSVIVNLAIDGERQGSIVVDERLGAGIWVQSE